MMLLAMRPGTMPGDRVDADSLRLGLALAARLEPRGPLPPVDLSSVEHGVAPLEVL